MTLALIAGQGALPRFLAEKLIAANDPPVICVFHTFVPDAPVELPRLHFRLETLGTFLATLVEAGVTRLCMAGAVRRYPIEADLIDERTRPLVARLTDAMAKGDDGTLREIVAIIEETGIKVVGPKDLVPELVLSAGIPTEQKPSPVHDQDVTAGYRELRVMGAADLGQACVIRAGKVVAAEEKSGTKALIDRFKAEPDPRMSVDPVEWAMDAVADIFKSDPVYDALPGEGMVLFKGPKPTQDLRVDLPTIGPDTAQDAAEAGFDGIIIQAGSVIVLDAPLVIDILNNAGMFLWVHEAQT
ncbi:LpxI family protein [Aestuariibius sp. HNIBRBA575]|uniref:LpxI family protein n=1 Tax=Aestuariibius sp. HNIBRBA575 TaxID=3233343 RepID=UPI0034A401A5